MTMTTQEPVVSGHGYTVTEVDGRPPAGLADCVGERLLTLVGNGLSHRVFGTGTAVPGGVRFHQKDLGPDGRDVRVWTIIISALDQATLIARHRTPSEPGPVAGMPG
jgi:hypothetical protein